MAEDRLIALAALAVTAVVGLAAPLGAVFVTNAHDDNRLRAERVQSDRADLRTVLDDAAAQLYLVGTLFQTTSIDPATVSRSYDSKRLQRPLRELGRLYNRVAIRLGLTAPATRAMKRALTTGLQVPGRIVSLAMLVDASDNVRIRGTDAVADRVGAYLKQTDRFVAEANRVAHSTTD